MGTITERKRTDGAISFYAQIIIKDGGAIVRRENKTFQDRRQAKAWIAAREVDRGPSMTDPTLGFVIERYIATSRRKIGRTKAQVLSAIKRDPLAHMKCSRIQSKDVVAFATRLAGGARTTQTVGNYVSHLASVFAIARPAWGYPLDEKAALDAAKVAKRLGIISRSKERTRRPTVEELDQLVDHFIRSRSKRIDSNPMADIAMIHKLNDRRGNHAPRLLGRHLHFCFYNESAVYGEPMKPLAANRRPQSPRRALRLDRKAIAQPPPNPLLQTIVLNSFFIDGLAIFLRY